MVTTSDQPILFPVPVTATKASKKKPADIIVNRVNRDIAKRRYYLHKQLDENFEVFAAARQIITDYDRFEAIPIGQRYYVGQLIQLGYEIQFKLYAMHASHQAKLLKAGFTIYHGTTVGAGNLVIKAKTPDNHNWHTIESGFTSKAAIKRRLQELDKLPKHIDLYDTKNTLVSEKN